MQCRLEAVVLDVVEGLIQPRLFGIGQAPRRYAPGASWQGDRPLYVAQIGDGTESEKAVDPFDDLRRDVLKLKRKARCDPKVENGVCALAAGKHELLWQGFPRQRLAHDPRPVGDEARLGEPAFAQGRCCNAGQIGANGQQATRFTLARMFWCSLCCRFFGHGGMVCCARAPDNLTTRETDVTPRRAPAKSKTRVTEPSAAVLLDWYDRHRRAMPWRALPGEQADPYHVWLSEIMLQQTTVATVGPYFERFLSRWPTVEALAAAKLDDVLHAWQGLGYYARARNLHKCAKAVTDTFGGRFPETEAALLDLPGVGPYTAAAVAAIAFDRKATVVDGNVERVMARLFAIETPLPAAKDEMRARAAELTPETRCGDYAQAVMDLGATICSPRSPACAICPWRSCCTANALGLQADLPRRAPKAQKPTRRGVAYWAVAADGAVLLRRRVESGLLGGMMEVPSTEWHEEGGDVKAAIASAPVEADWKPIAGLVRHTFTHFHLELTVVAATVSESAASEIGGVWCPAGQFADYALPTVMKKVVRLAAGARTAG